MGKPTAVKKASDLAEAIHKEAYKQETPAEGGEAPEGKESADVVNIDAQAAEAAPEQQQEPAQQPEAKPEAQPDTWEHKYNTLQGMFNTLKSQADGKDADINRLQAELSGLQSVLATMQSAPAAEAAPKAEAEQEQPGTSGLSPQEVEEYGADLIDIMKKAAKEAVAGELEQLRTENNTLKQKLGGVSNDMAQSARQELINKLNAEVPNWQAMNTDQTFLDWLKQVDTYAGARRQMLLTQAYEANDAPRVIAFFKGFLTENAAVSPGSASAQQAATPPTRQPKVDMGSLIAPGTPTPSGSASVNEGKKLWSNREISQFYQDVNRGKYRGRDADKQKIEVDIVAAAAEGRITA